MGQNVSSAVMAQRKEPHDSLDYFPTPPWATRALCEFLEKGAYKSPFDDVWEPACGEGHMARPLREYFHRVYASDVHDYGYGDTADFLWESDQRADWIITNPPFNLALQFALTGMQRARHGVALLVRTAWLDGGVSAQGRFRSLFSPHPPSEILQFCDRVPMVKGRLVEDVSTATAYCWVMWRHRAPHGTQFHWIEPCRRRLERAGDYPVLPLAEDLPGPLP